MNLQEVDPLYSLFRLSVSLNVLLTLFFAARQASNNVVNAALREFFVQASQAVWSTNVFTPPYCSMVSSRYLDRLPNEFDHLQLRFKPLVPMQPRPQLLLRHVSENLPPTAASAVYSTGNAYGQAQPGGNTSAQRIFECMKTLIEKQSLSEQVCCSSPVFCFFLRFCSSGRFRASQVCHFRSTRCKTRHT